MSKRDPIQVTPDRWPGMHYFITLKREAKGQKKLTQYDTSYDTEIPGIAGIITKGEKNLKFLASNFGASDLRDFVSSSPRTRLLATIKMRGWRGRKLWSIMVDKEDERIIVEDL